MEHLSNPNRVIAVFFKILRQSLQIGLVFPEMSDLVPDLDRVRPHPGQQTRPGGVANGLLGIGTGEYNSLAGKAVNVGAHDHIISITSQLRSEVINDEEEDVGLPLYLLSLGQERAPGENAGGCGAGQTQEFSAFQSVGGDTH